MKMYSLTICAAFSCEELSDAQKLALVHLTLGRDLTTIAHLMNYEVQTVKNYLLEARERLHARTNEEACWLAHFTGQISDAAILAEYTRDQEA